VINKIVLIGASTGGPGQIEKIIAALPPLYDTTLIIAQHMAAEFIPSFIKRVQKYDANPLSLAYHNKMIQTANIYFCTGTTSAIQRGHELYFSVEASQESRYNPDINTIFKSFVPFANNIKFLAIILTGIGDDGVEGCKELSLAGAKTATQNAQSAIVDGMTSRARKDVPNIEVLDIEEIKNKIKEFCS
jgi:two-component system chemotaxis response regulator CheB